MKYIKTFEDFINESKLNEAKDFSAYDEINKYRKLKGKTVEYNFGTDKKPEIEKIKIKDIRISNPGGNAKVRIVGDAMRLSTKTQVEIGVKSIEDVENYIKEEVINEGVIMVYHYSKKSKEITDDVKDLKKKAQEYIKTMRDKDYNISSNDSVLYFPNFTWAGGRQEFGPSLAILAGSETMLVNPIGTDRIIKINEKMLARLIKDGRLESYNLY